MDTRQVKSDTLVALGMAALITVYTFHVRGLTNFNAIVGLTYCTFLHHCVVDTADHIFHQLQNAFPSLRVYFFHFEEVGG